MTGGHLAPVPWSFSDDWSPHCSCIFQGPMLTGPDKRYPHPGCPVHQPADLARADLDRRLRD